MRNSVGYVAVFAATLALSVGTPAQAEKVSPAIAKTLQAAQNASKARKWGECLSNLRTADAAGGKTAYDSFIINELTAFCALSSNDIATATRAYEANLGSPFAADKIAQRTRDLTKIYFNARNYAKTVELGKSAIKSGYADSDTYLVVSQSYYQQNDFKNARDFVGSWIKDQERRGQRPKENAIQIYVTSCMRLKDEACTAAGFEKLVTYYPNPAGWANLMQSLFEARNEAAAFNAYRLATDVGAMRRADDYTEMAQRAIEKGLPGEAQKTLEAAFAAKVFTEKRDIDRNQRLLNSAKERAAADRASLAKQDRDAAANKSADADIRVGQAFMSYGQYPQAVAALQRGIAKGTATDPAEAQLVLGIAHLRGGNKAEAAKALRSVKGDQDMQRIAKLWSLRAQ
jgi:tetratricopeptide (TPR) repeat protein